MTDSFTRAHANTHGEAQASVVQLAEECHAPLDPMLLWFVSGELHSNDKVGGVSRGGEGATTVARLVERGHVGLFVGDFVAFHWL